MSPKKLLLSVSGHLPPAGHQSGLNKAVLTKCGSTSKRKSDLGTKKAEKAKTTYFFVSLFSKGGGKTSTSKPVF